MKRHSVLIVDDDIEFLSETKNALSAKGYDVFTAPTGGDAKMIFNKHRPSLALLDKKLPDMDGQDLVKDFSKQSKEISFIIITGYGSMDSSIKGFKDGISDYIVKPASVEDILNKIENAINVRERNKKKIEIFFQEYYAEHSKYETLFEEAHDAIFIAHEEDMTIVDCNKAASQLTGYTKKELIGKSTDFLCPEDEKQELAEIFGHYAEKNKLIEERSILGKDGRRIPVLINTAILDVGSGKYIQVAFRDITKLKLQQEENEKLLRVAKDISESVVITDSGSIVKFCNKATENIFGYREEELAGKHPSLLLSKFNPPLLNAEIEKKIMNGQGWRGEVICRRKDGSSFPAMLWVYPWKDDLGHAKGAIGITVDITEKRLLEDELRRYAQNLEHVVKQRTEDYKKACQALEEANKKLKRYDTLKSEFVANVAHELNNSLGILKGSVNVVLDGLTGKTNNETVKILNILKNEIERLIRFTSNMLDLSRIESGEIPVNKTWLNIKNVLSEVVLSFRNDSNKRGINLITDIKDVPENILADRDLIKQVFINLINNALKYTPRGKQVEVKAQQKDNTLCLEIKDQGPGIPKDMQERIFDKFYRLSENKQEGTGLGLTIVKEIVKLLKGNIRVESEETKGANFIVNLPLE